MSMDRWQKVGVAGLATIGLGFAGFSGVKMGSSPPTGEQIRVQVTGAVARPGLVTVERRATLQDAIHAAGGARKHADLTSLDLSENVVEGMRVVIGDPMTSDPATPSQSFVERPKSAPAANASEGEIPADGVNLNTASQVELEALPGIGPVTAQKIIALRQARGRFSRVDELLDVKGIGPKKMEAVRPFVRL